LVVGAGNSGAEISSSTVIHGVGRDAARIVTALSRAQAQNWARRG